MMRFTSSPAIAPASLVAFLCASLKYAGTVIIASVIFPIIVISLMTKVSYKRSFLLPLHLKNKKATYRYALAGSLGVLVITLIFVLFFLKYLDFSSITQRVMDMGITSTTYPFVALAIVLINPFLEEYFWRGFVFRVFDKYTNKGIWTGVLFALHHVIIIWGSINLIQSIIVIFFLAIIGILFNWIYSKTGSIYATWIIHALADLVIVTVGFFILF